MLAPDSFLAALEEAGITFFCGVPDSLLAPFCACAADSRASSRHVIAANEGNAVGMAAGHYLASGSAALVYMQNSGLGNAVNPLLSLMDPDVYSLPVLLLIGWRGEPGIPDEPQHAKQGKVTLELLDAMGIPHAMLPAEIPQAGKALEAATEYMRRYRAPYCLVVSKNTFAPWMPRSGAADNAVLEREEAIRRIAALLPEDAIIVGSTGKISRELFEYRAETGQGHQRDFLTIGSMGHSSSIALGIALRRPERTVVCLEGDGAAIMHAGSLAVIGQQCPVNLLHIVLNNASHDSVGGQPTAGAIVDFPAMALASGYRAALRTEDGNTLEDMLRRMVHTNGPCFLEVKVKKGSRAHLGRPTRSPRQNRDDFMRFAGSR